MGGSVMSLDGKRVVVIGGASGIGFAVAELAKELGAAVVIGSSREANVAAAVDRLPGADGHAIDLRDETNVAAFFETLGAFDHLVVTAGDWSAAMFGSTADVDLVQAREGLNVRFWGVLASAKYACRTIARDGSITLTSGMLAHRPTKGSPLATAIGGAVEHLARGLAVDLAPVRVNAVCPGIIRTDHTEKMMTRERLDAFTAPLPLGRAGSPAEAAQAYVQAILNRYMTGQVLHVDGGGMLV